jgi:NADPH:quinone reductase-like Zn-dependent oxidoreductase
MARIVRFHEYGDASVLEIEKLYVPPPCADEVRIDVKSIGFNRGGGHVSHGRLFSRGSIPQPPRFRAG